MPNKIIARHRAPNGTLYQAQLAQDGCADVTICEVTICQVVECPRFVCRGRLTDAGIIELRDWDFVERSTCNLRLDDHDATLAALARGLKNG